MKQLEEAQFIKDVSDHKMTVLHDSGVHRCIRFANPASSNLYFMLTTWPGHLCICGDMGTYVFNRLEDMFEFFRSGQKPGKLYINTGYWEEKCEAADRRTGGQVDEYCEDRFKSVVGELFNQHEFENEADKAACWEEIKDEVLCAENEHEAFNLAGQFSFKGEDDEFEFSDFWEHDLRSYTYQYLWCCYAIAWGIQQYDLATTPVLAGEECQSQ